MPSSEFTEWIAFYGLEADDQRAREASNGGKWA